MRKRHFKCSLSLSSVVANLGSRTPKGDAKDLKGWGGVVYLEVVKIIFEYVMVMVKL